MKGLLVLLTALALIACGNDPYRNQYDGLRSDNDTKRATNERAKTPAPGHDEHKKEHEGKPKE